MRPQVIAMIDKVFMDLIINRVGKWLTDSCATYKPYIDRMGYPVISISNVNNKC